MASIYNDYTIPVTIHEPISAGFGFIVTDMENTKSNYIVCFFKTLPHNCFTLKSTARHKV